MKKLRTSATITFILGLVSLFALICLFLALSNIADQAKNLTLEWRITGICLIIIGAFVISTLITIWLFYKSINKNSGHE